MVHLTPAGAALICATLIPIPSLALPQPQPPYPAAECLHPQPKSCSFYTSCVEKQYPCGPEGYAVGYGDKYCNKFADNIQWFSPKGKEWIWNVMTCLQTSLVPLLTTPPQGQLSTQCQVIKSTALQSHSACYVQTGVCTIPPTDWFVLANIIGMIDLDVIKEALATAEGCGKEYIEIVKKLLEGIGK